MEQAKKGDWVQIYKVLLPPGERAPGLPPETAAAPLAMKVKGHLIEETATAGDVVSVQTITGRIVTGELIAVNPAYRIDYGCPQPELLNVGAEARRLLNEEAEVK
ncbi:MAG: 2-amino-4-ketopentanoate thiolase [Dethiobacter sp.]|nr:2-amino-4-ketopentanoate thiolase [Dethiobacter sp.]